MSHARYFLLQQDGLWLVTLEGRVMALCGSRTEAIEAAVTMADLMGAMHYDADVMVEADDGPGLEIVWSYGRSPAPTAAARSHEPAPQQHHVRLIQRGEARSARA